MDNIGVILKDLDKVYNIAKRILELDEKDINAIKVNRDFLLEKCDEIIPNVIRSFLGNKEIFEFIKKGECYRR